ncbi:hypothetical protein A8C56_03275 [Niabella ginsenosidivorans]|uniref:DUF3810 domain-containing protein n=2 Tax=Niabella ginsenosidivorans TaxID=1176587 RepID=A0A1A9IAG5_9BACT|nr:hypothetical protein A8C56_03275 [Niabella ginsenosidivorans]
MKLIRFVRKHRAWVIIAVLAVVIKVVSFFPDVVEKYYAHGVYIFISRLLRFLFGWLPFSIGDIVYAGVITGLIIYIVRVIKRLFKKKAHLIRWKKYLAACLFTILCIYVIFYSFWGLNYSRQSIEEQFGLNTKNITARDLDTLAQLLHDRINREASEMSLAGRDSLLDNDFLFKQSQDAYRLAQQQYPFLNSRPASVKSSLFGELMNYSGLQGYYNPFSGEAQVNTTIPVFLLPSIVTHEMGHQVGYAKESEANFLSFLTSHTYPSVHFRYSTDFVMYAYAVNELYLYDSMKVKAYDSTLHPRVKRDFQTYREFYRKYENRIEPVIHWIYGNYLRANNQPSGNRSYDEVVIWLIGWYRKYGRAAI